MKLKKVCDKFLVSPELLIYLAWTFFPSDHELFNLVNKKIIEHNDKLLGISSSSFILIQIGVLFPFKDGANLMKGFPKKQELYETCLAGALHYILFSLLLVASFFHEVIVKIGVNKYYPIVSVFGLLVLIITTGMAFIHVNILLRDSG
ncbi:putative membrane protein [Halobacteriovorax marinus SJ]|uniref:Membrane protein n=1 Tax=Halobacteriovorax marinus (strain ATCC BAA-682 / DSM 15412 / SJ) TaxID=862908 RepID=E1X5X1_HALMS|nr:hypothetical protein [Halobacteriovorax marinus]CBW25688.1 putative membrane protein [Halobacteriovorax marinus SJ]